MIDQLQTEAYLTFLETFITRSRKEKIDEILNKRTEHFTVVVEDIFQLHNTSAVLRSCEVFGWQNIHVVEEKYGNTIDKEIALGAQKWLDIHRYSDVNHCINLLREKEYQIVATTPHENAIQLSDFDISKPTAIFFGTEKNGLSNTVLKNADCKLKIPMYGFTESLNISVSAAIIIQYLNSKLRNSDIPWVLSPDKKFEKRLDWTKKSIKNLTTIEKKYLMNINVKD
jgi:tRNA (guanosine-2'-O-)-methyltransferase